MRTDIIEKKKQILEWIDEHESKAFMCKELNCKPETLNNYLKKMNIIYLGNKGAKGKKTDYKRLTIDELITRPWVGSYRLKIRLFEDGYKEKKCEKCGGTKWFDNEIPLELHHIDGKKFNNELNNLMILCPNCHALEPNNSGAASKKCPSDGTVDMPHLE